ncbi:MAG: PIN domain-containing protein [Nitrososphaerales archaeon]
MDRINRAHPIVLDTTFILPAFGVEIEIDSTESVQEKIREVRESQETPILISDLSPLESFLKAFRLAEKAKSEEGKKAAKTGHGKNRYRA